MSEFKKRSFEYTPQETYSQGELENILSQHKTFIAGASKKELETMQEKITKLETENKEYSSKENSRTIKKLAKTISEDNYEKLVKYTSIKEGATEDEIKTALEATAKDFAPAKVEDTSKPKVETAKTPKVEPVKETEDDEDDVYNQL